MRLNITLASALIALTFAAAVPSPVSAATRSYTWYSYASTRPYDGDAGFSRSGYSSSIRNAINKLDKDPVEDLPIPVLFIKRSSITPNFGDPRDGGTRTHQGEDILAP